MRPERPHLLGLVCWTLIIGNMVDLYQTMKKMGQDYFAKSLEGFPYPPRDVEIILFATMAIFIITGILMYEGQGWARYIYLANALPYLGQHYLAAAQVITSNVPFYILAAEVAFFLVSLVIIFLPQVQRYFHPPRYVDEL